MKLKAALPVSIAAVTLLTLAGCDKPPPIAPELQQAMETRHHGFEAIGDSMKTIADAMKAGSGLTPEVVAAANKINEFAPQLETWFPAGSGPETKRKTRAKAEIWQQPEAFVQKREALVTEAAKLAELANANDAEGFAAQVSVLGETCKGCHEDFRVPKQ